MRQRQPFAEAEDAALAGAWMSAVADKLTEAMSLEALQPGLHFEWR